MKVLAARRRTVLVRDIPLQDRTEENVFQKMRAVYPDTRSVVLVRDTSKLNEAVKKRDEVCVQVVSQWHRHLP